jgi:hypothetical protein
MPLILKRYQAINKALGRSPAGLQNRDSLKNRQID